MLKKNIKNKNLDIYIKTMKDIKNFLYKHHESKNNYVTF